MVIKKKNLLWMTGIVAFFLAAAVIWLLRGRSEEKSRNLALQKGVKAASDSAETAELSAQKAIDGDDTSLSSRWSSENNWESAAHYIELEFPEEISVSFVVLKWERRNVTAYQLEGSLNGTDWQILAAFDHAPESKRQEIPLQEAVTVRYLRLSTSAVSVEEADYSNLYQNISLYEFEVYAEKPIGYRLDAPTIETGQDGNRYLRFPEVPDGYRITYIGADYEQVIGAGGEVYETIQEKEVTVGFLVESLDGQEEAEEVEFSITVPAAADTLQGENAEPAVLPAIAEWDGDDGFFCPGESSRILIEKSTGQASEWEALQETAKLFARQYQDVMGNEIPVVEGSQEELQPGDFYLAYGDDGSLRGLGEEGYLCTVDDKCVITAPMQQGIRWGTITVLQILKESDGRMPRGKIRDYPRYQVRGFGIDVARKPVSLAMLYQIMENMSWYKMNDFSIHLNDNVILSTSGLTGSVEEAMTAYSAFRLESEISNDRGEKLTAGDYAYTAEDFSQFIQTSQLYGVRVVPEIDTPAHSLAITGLFPEYALTERVEAVDQIDLSNRDAVAFVKEIWREALSGSVPLSGEAQSGVGGQAAFAHAGIVNIGMDEYYGDGETYRRYLKEIIELVREESDVEAVRLWGSLDNIEGTTMPEADGLQMNIWSTIWADPLTAYEAGYSVINMQNNHLYLIPGGGYDYLDVAKLWQNWEANKFYDYNQLERIPVYSPQMLGAAYMIWNDMSGSLDIGISEADLFDRFFRPLGALSQKLWGETGAADGSAAGKGEIEAADSSYTAWEEIFSQMGTAPGSNPYAKAEPEELENAIMRLFDETDELVLQGRTDFYETGYQGGNGNGIGIGGSYTVSMEVYREPFPGTAREEILFETDSAYGQTAFKAVQKETGQVGFSREGRDYSFAYTLPEEEWVALTVRGEANRTSLYVDGALVDVLGNEKPFEEYATFVFPLERIGSRTAAFCGRIRNVSVTVAN